MKKVSFGYENSMNPVGSFEGIGLGGGAVGPTEGEFIEVINLMDQMDNNYLVTRITNTFKGSEHEIGKIDVRRVLADLFPDGSAILYVDQTHSYDCERIEQILNTSRAKGLIEDNVKARELCTGKRPAFSFECATNKEKIVVTAIPHEVFENKKQLISRCRSSFSDMQRKLEEQYVNEYSNGRSL